MIAKRTQHFKNFLLLPRLFPTYFLLLLDPYALSLADFPFPEQILKRSVFTFGYAVAVAHNAVPANRF